MVAKQSRCEENTIVGNYFFIFYDMPHFVRRDIFAFAKVILRLRRSDIINKHKSNSLIPPQPKQGGSETKPS